MWGLRPLAPRGPGFELERRRSAIDVRGRFQSWNRPFASPHTGRNIAVPPESPKLKTAGRAGWPQEEGQTRGRACGRVWMLAFEGVRWSTSAQDSRLRKVSGRDLRPEYAGIQTRGVPSAERAPASGLCGVRGRTWSAAEAGTGVAP